MTNLLEIKPYIRDFVEEILDSAFKNKVYWIAERRNIPEYPYCVLNVVTENKDKRTSHHQGNLRYDEFRERITTIYKTCTITISVYNGWTSNTTNYFTDMDEANEFLYEQIDNLECAFEDYYINNKFSIQTISPIRQLHETVDGGYMYRYEFDLTIGYNEIRTNNKPLGNNIEVILVDTNEADTVIKNDSVYIGGEDAIENDLNKDYFETRIDITVDDNDNIIVET